MTEKQYLLAKDKYLMRLFAKKMAVSLPWANKTKTSIEVPVPHSICGGKTQAVKQ
jgi:hypothetical protein